MTPLDRAIARLEIAVSVAITATVIIGLITITMVAFGDTTWTGALITTAVAFLVTVAILALLNDQRTVRDYRTRPDESCGGRHCPGSDETTPAEDR